MTIQRHYLGGKLRGRQLKWFYIIILLVLLFTSGFGYVEWNSRIGGGAIRIVYLIFTGLLLFNFPKNAQCNFKADVFLLMLLPMPSMINSYLYYSQSFIESLWTMWYCAQWAFYFILHKYKVSEATILKSILVIAVFIAILQIVQQLTYPNVYFGVMSEDEMLEAGKTESTGMRNGLWRFRLGSNGFYTAPVLFAVWTWLRNRYERKLVLLASLLMVSIYLTLTRQVMVSCILTLFFSYMMSSCRISIRSFAIGVVGIIGLCIFYDVLFSELLIQTREDANDDNIRILSATYFLNHSLRNPLTLVFGYGTPFQGGQYDAYIKYAMSMMGFYTSDVGCIGELFTKGLIYIIVCYRLFYRLFFQLSNVIPIYIRMFVLFAFAMSIMIFPFVGKPAVFVWTLILYVCDLHINHSSLALCSTKKN